MRLENQRQMKTISNFNSDSLPMHKYFKAKSKDEGNQRLSKIYIGTNIAIDNFQGQQLFC